MRQRTLWTLSLTVGLLILGAVAFGPALFAMIANGEWRGLLQLLQQPLFNLGSVPITLASIAKTVVFLFLLAVFVRLARRFIRERLLSLTAMDEGQRFAYSRIAGYTIYIVGLAIGLQTAGVNLNSLVVLGGAVGIGVGLGLQNLANNFVSGLVLLVERPIKMGDRVEVGGVFGDVVRMAGRSTWVRTNENVVIIVPNSEFTSSRVTNWTANDRSVRFSIAVGVSYGSDPAKVREILMASAQSHPDVLDDPVPDVLFVGFGDSALNFELRVWTIRQVQTPKVLASDLYFAVFDAFKREGIEIPFPQRDLHLKSVSTSISVSPA
jgi:small-conductance mechanosensitive channel